MSRFFILSQLRSIWKNKTFFISRTSGLVFGISAFILVALLINQELSINKSFVSLITISFIIACSAAYSLMSKLLENYAYKVTLSLWGFALEGALASGISLLTVSWQSWRAATRNPVEALRYE